jgi:O-antigen/teichoic acid export membrane protein
MSGSQTDLPSVRRLARDSAAYGFGSIAVRAAPLLLVPLLVHGLQPAQYGLLDLASTLAAVLAVTIGVGLDAASARLYFDLDDDAGRRSLLLTALSLQLLMALLVTGVLLLVAPLWAGAVTGRTDQVLDIRLALLSIPSTAALTVITAGLRVRGRIAMFNTLALWQAGVLVLLTGIVLETGHRDPAAVLLAAALASALGLLVGLVITGRDLAARPSLRMAGQLLRYGTPLVPVALVAWTLPLLARLAIEHLRGPTDVAMFAFASKIAAMAGLLISAFQLAWGPFALSIARRPDAPAVYARVLRTMLVPVCATGVLLAVTARTIVEVIGTHAYLRAAPLVPWLVIAAIATGAFQVTTIGAVVSRRTDLVAAASLGSLGLCAALVVPLAALAGGEGAAIANAAALLVGAYLPIPLTRRLFPVPFSLRPILPFLLASAAVAAVGSRWVMTGAWHQALLAASLSVAYSAGLLIWARRTGLLPADTRALLGAARRRLARAAV